MSASVLPARVLVALPAFERTSGCQAAVLTPAGDTLWGELPAAVSAAEVICATKRTWLSSSNHSVLVVPVGTGERPLWMCSIFAPLQAEQRSEMESLFDAVCIAAWDAHRLHDEIESMQLMFQSVLDTIPVRVFWKDLAGKYLGANQLFAKDAGFTSPEELLGKDDFAMPWGPEAELYRADDKAVVASGEPKIDYEEPQTTPTGDSLWLQTSKIPLRDTEGAVFGLLGTYANITARKLAEQGREQLLEELERKNLELERFTHTVSHDLKGPVVTIRGFAGVLLEELGASEAVESDVREAIEHGTGRIEKAASTMASMLDELLELSRAGRVLGVREPHPLRALVDEALLLCAGAIKASDATVHISAELPVVVVDGARMVQVFQNLIDNACKYRSPARRLEIRILADADGRVELTDNGIGIPERQREEVFRPFRKLDPSMPGSGIGLSLVRRIIEAHGGRVSVTSDNDSAGTTFSFRLEVAHKGVS